MPQPKNLLQLLKADKQVTYIAELDGDRHLFRAPVSLLHVHPQIKKLRAKDPKSVALLRDTMKRTGNTCVYPICVFLEKQADGGLRYWIGDGVQRKRAAEEEGIKEIVCQWIARWSGPNDVMREGLGLNNARYQMSDLDVISTLSAGLLLLQQHL